MQKKQPETEDIVKLKPFMGMRPGVWLCILYSAILFVIIFLLLILPGLINYGAELVLTTEPQGAAIRVDGVYMGTSKDRIFVPRGVHTIMAVLPGFEYESVRLQIPGRVFGSLFFPIRLKAKFTLKAGDPAAAFAEAAADFAEWSFAGEPTSTWQIPLALSEGAYRTGQAIAGSQASQQTAAQILTAAARFTSTRAAMRDTVRAKMLLDNGGLSPSPASAYGSVSDILAFLSDNPGSAEWLFGLLPAEAAAMVKASDWYKKEAASRAGAPPKEPSGTGSINFAGLSFSGVSYFMISGNTVSRAAFENFLKENPEWEDIGNSWFAVSEYCRQLTNRLPSSMAGMEVRLPTEAEWETAAARGLLFMGESRRPVGLSKNKETNSGAANTGEGGWEWCADPFAPLQFIKADANAVKMIGSPERSLRSSVDSSRASLPPEFSSPIVSFRLVIAPRNSGF